MDDNIFDPQWRDMHTIRLSPSLASHAPNVSKINAAWGKYMLFVHEIVINNNILINMAASKNNNIIKRWGEPISNVTIRMINLATKKEEMASFIRAENYFTHWLTRPVLYT